MAVGISVLMPVFNGEAYLEQTLRSLLSQDFDDFEILAVDDCSTDDSFGLLERMSSVDRRLRVFRTERNVGIVPKVINFIRNDVLGDYFVYSSQDDVHSKDWLGAMYKRAEESGADATIPDLVFWHENNPSRNRIISGVRGDRAKIVSGRDAFELSLDWTIPGNALWKSRLLREIPFFDFSYNADEYTVRIYLLNCNYVVFSGGVFYYRQDNNQAITKKFTEKWLGGPRTDLMLCRTMADYSFPDRQLSIRLAKSIHRMLILAGEGGAKGLSKAVIKENVDLYRDTFSHIRGSDLSKREFKLGDWVRFFLLQIKPLFGLCLFLYRVRYKIERMVLRLARLGGFPAH